MAVLVLILVGAGALFIALVAAFALVLMGWNLVAVLTIRYRCHGSWVHPKRAHRGDSDRDRAAQKARPLWRWLLELPPVEIRRR